MADFAPSYASRGSRNNSSKKRKADTKDHTEGPNRKHKNRTAPSQFNGPARPKKHAIHPLKDQIRDLERLLAKDTGMPANVRSTRERELESLKHQLVITAAQKEKQKMIERYHMVRFFDRKKAERALRKANKALAECDDGDDREELERQAYTAQIDLNYTIYAPLDAIYSSLYPSKKDADGKIRSDNDAITDGVRGNPDMWTRVELATKVGKLDALRNNLDLERARQILAIRTKKPPTSKDKSDVEKPEIHTEQFSFGASGSMAVRGKGRQVENDSDESEGGVRLDAGKSDDEDGFFE